MNKRKIKIALIIAFIIILEILFFRNVMFNNQLLGDTGDGRYICLMLEHFFEAVKGEAPIAGLRIFYPAHNTLGYSDMLIGLSIPYILFRFVGVDMVMATKYACILIHTIGTIAIMFFLKKEMKLRTIPAMIGTLCFSYANSYAIANAHVQLYALSFVPILLVLGSRFIKNIQNNKRHIFAVIFVTLYALVFYTSFYTGYFMTLNVGLIFVFLVLKWIISKKEKRKEIAEKVKENLKHNWIFYILYGVYGILIMIPFLKVYLAVQSSVGGFESLGNLQWFRIFDLGDNNLLYGKLMEQIPFKRVDIESGFPIFEIIIFLVSTIIIWKKEKNTKLVTILAITVFILYIIPTEFFGFSLWDICREIVPGATAVRATSRFYWYLILPVGIVIASACNYILSDSKKEKIIQGILVVVLLVIALENTQKIGVYAEWNRDYYYEIEETITQPPENCTIFYVTDSSNKKYKKNWEYQLEAWMIADKYKLKTFNGYSGKFPDGWKLLEPRDEEIYANNIDHWIHLYGMQETKIYAYDVSTHEWNVHE